MTPRKPRLPDDVHDVWNVEVGKPYRGQYVEKIDIETTKLPENRVKVRRLIHLDNQIIIIEDTWHDHDEVFCDGELLPYDQINFPSMDPADFKAPVKKKKGDADDDEEKKKKRDLLRQRAKEMLNKKKGGDPPPPKKDPELKLKVKTPDGKLLPVTLKPDETVDDLKDKIEDGHGIPSEDQKLSHKGRPLEDPDATLKDSGIKNGDVIDLAPTTMNITVETPEGDKIPLVVTPNDTVRDIKNKVEDEHGMPAKDQKLSFRGTPLDDPSSTLDDHGIGDGDTLRLQPTTLAVTIRTPDGTTMRVNVDPKDTVRDLKKTIERDREIPVADQNLSRKGVPMDDPDSTMEDHGVENEDVLDLTDVPFGVNVGRPDGTTFPLTVKPSDTVKKVKKKIQQEEGIPVGDQKLGYEGDPLDDPGATLQDLGVTDGDTLDLGKNGKSIWVRKPDGSKFPLDVAPDDTVRTVKKKIESDQGIPTKEQDLSHAGTPLDDDYATLDDLGVDDGDTVDLGEKKKPTPPPPRGKTKTKKAKQPRARKLNPDSAWVFPIPASAPAEGEEDNLQGVWSTAPNASSGTDPVEVNIHPMHKEPKSTGDTVHGAYGYVNGAKPDENGVVDPANVMFYPPGETKFRPDFEQVGWWSAPEASSKTKVKWWFEGDDCIHHRVHTVKVCGHEMVFESTYTK